MNEDILNILRNEFPELLDSGSSVNYDIGNSSEELIDEVVEEVDYIEVENSTEVQIQDAEILEDSTYVEDITRFYEEEVDVLEVSARQTNDDDSLASDLLSSGELVIDFENFSFSIDSLDGDEEYSNSDDTTSEDTINVYSSTSESRVEEEGEEEVTQPREQIVSHSRFKGASWYDIIRTKEVILAGLGGIGSWVSLFLSRVGISKLILYDFDTFESHNMSGQALLNDFIGLNKVSGAVRLAREFSNFTEVVPMPIRYSSENGIVSDIMICGFDNMEARKSFYNNWKFRLGLENVEPKNCLFIDGRLTAEMFQIFIIQGDDVFSQTVYESEWLFDDSMAEEEDCTLKQTTHLAAMIASYMVNFFTSWCNNLSEGNIPRRIPYIMEYNSILNTYNYEY